MVHITESDEVNNTTLMLKETLLKICFSIIKNQFIYI